MLNASLRFLQNCSKFHKSPCAIKIHFAKSQKHSNLFSLVCDYNSLNREMSKIRISISDDFTPEWLSNVSENCFFVCVHQHSLRLEFSQRKFSFEKSFMPLI